MKAIAHGLSPSRKEWQSNDWLALPQKLLIDKKQISCRKRWLSVQITFPFPMVWLLIICARYPKNQFPIPFCVPVISWALEGARLWNLLKNKVELGQNQKGTEIKCRSLDLAFVGIFPSYFRGDIKAWEVNVKMEKKTRRAPCSGAPRVVQIHDSLHSSPRRSR